MCELALHPQQRRAPLVLRATASLDFDGDGLSFFAVLFRSGARTGQTVDELASLLLDAFARGCDLGAPSGSSRTSRLALVAGRDQRLLLGREIRDGAIE